MKTVEDIIEIINNRIVKAKNDAEEAYSDMQYERSKGAQYELEELLEEIIK